MTAVEVSELVKRRPKSRVNAVDGITFAVEPGEVFGLLGPNGAGKTTTVGMLTTRVKPTGGRALVGGVDIGADPVLARSMLAVVPQRSNLDRSLSIRRNLTFHAAYHGVPSGEASARAEELLEQFGLRERGNVKPDLFSGGQAQRVMIARARSGAGNVGRAAADQHRVLAGVHAALVHRLQPVPVAVVGAPPLVPDRDRVQPR